MAKAKKGVFEISETRINQAMMRMDGFSRALIERQIKKFGMDKMFRDVGDLRTGLMDDRIDKMVSGLDADKPIKIRKKH